MRHITRDLLRQDKDDEFEGLCSGCGDFCQWGLCQNVDCLESPWFGEEDFIDPGEIIDSPD